MPKILKPYTIIPLDLYVHRDADRQIRNIIKDMGRPGYVLVSRQMGKTNLLINAKRELEDSHNIFVYIDLSNTFYSSKECFENIINTILETNQELEKQAKTLIEEKRKEFTETPAHKQHLNELRTVLSFTPNKLVIILDEIDALIKTTYSDQVFSQIRSIYFTRVNFPEFEKLTYILSGVIEPSEIIKDSKISPFNIGQKIFLNDFSEIEFHTFLNKANLRLNEEIRNRIYYWTNGNPRMTWDLCSEVENYIKTKEISVEDIDNIVNNLYLTTFDKPPIDNIREIIKNDRDIRNSILDLENKNYDKITDKIKNKLYLAGIINYVEDEIKIKNNIIKNSLNLKWLRSIEEEEKGLVKIAFEYFENEKFDLALKTFEKYLENSNFTEEESNLCYFYMGFSSYKLLHFENAIDYLNKSNFDIDDEAKLYFRVQNLKGLVYFYLGEIGLSLECLKTVITKGRKDEIYARSLLNFGSISIDSKLSNYREEAIQIFKDIIEEKGLDNAKLKPEFLNNLKAIAYYNLAQIYIVNKNLIDAKQFLLDSLKFATTLYIPTIYLALYKTAELDNEKKEFLNSAIEAINVNNLIPKEYDIEFPLNYDKDKLRSLLIKSYLTDDNLLNSITEQFKHIELNNEDSNINTHLFNLAIYSYNLHKYETGNSILSKLISNNGFNDKLDSETHFQALKVYVYFSHLKKPNKFIDTFCDLFIKRKNETLDHLDLDIFANQIYILTNSRKYELALKYVSVLNQYRDKIDKVLISSFLVIDHLELNLHIYSKNILKAKEKATQILEIAQSNQIEPNPSSLLSETGLDIIRENAKSVIDSSLKRIPLKSSKTYNRNQFVKVRYKDGTIISSKYKKVFEDIQKGNCIILLD